MSDSATITGWCQRGRHTHCDGTLRGGTGWNWWCTCTCHPEPVAKDPSHRPAVEYWRKHRALGGVEGRP